MTTRKVTLSLDSNVYAMAEEAAARSGVSTSAWISRAARREAVRTGYRPGAEADEQARADALDDLAIEGAAEEHMREAG